MATSPAPAIRDWSELPLICSVEDVSRLFGRTPRGVQAGVTRNTFPVMPFQMRPMRWKRSDLQAHYEDARSVKRPRRVNL